MKFPYFLIFYPEAQELSLYRRGRSRYVSVTANAHERFAVPEMEVEVALLNGWTRFWFRGELLLLAGEWLKELDRQAQQADAAEQENARLREELERLRKG